MTWQKCPICDGMGFGLLTVNDPCTVCNGMKIINGDTGLPPEVEKVPEKEECKHNWTASSVGPDYRFCLLCGKGKSPGSRVGEKELGEE